MTASQNSDQLFIGIDLGGTMLKAALVGATGEIFHEIRVDSEQQNSERLFQQVIEAVQTLRDDTRTRGQVTAIGIGVPGLVNRKTNRIEVMPNLPELSEIDITTDLSRKTGLPVVIDNDANAAAYGELQAGAARGRRDVFFVTLGTGIGANLRIGGKMIH